MLPPVRARWGSIPSAWAAARRDTSMAATAEARAAAPSWTSMRGLLTGGSRRGRRPPCGETSYGRGVDLVLVETSQLLGQQLGHVPALQRHRTVGPSGRREGGELAVPPLDPDLACLGLEHDLGDAGPRGA